MRNRAFTDCSTVPFLAKGNRRPSAHAGIRPSLLVDVIRTRYQTARIPSALARCLNRHNKRQDGAASNMKPAVPSKKLTKREKRIIAYGMAYLALTIGCIAVFLFNYPNNLPVVHKFFTPLWHATNDPVLAFLLRTVNVLLIAAIIPGMVSTFIFFFILACGVNILIAGIRLTVSLAELSPMGALLVFGTVGFPLWWLLFRKYWEKTQHALDLILAVLMWIRHPQIRNSLRKIAQGGKTIMDNKELELHNYAVRLADVLGMSQSLVPTQLEGYDGYFREARKRIQIGSLLRTRDKELLLLNQAIAFFDKIHALKLAQGGVTLVDLEMEEKVAGLRARIRKLNMEGQEADGTKPKSKKSPDDDDIIGR